MSQDRDTIDIRPDERFDEGRLADYLRGKLPGSDRPLTVQQFGGGAANLTYLLDYGKDEYVLRRPPLGPVAKSAHDMGREYQVLSVLYKAYPLAPKAYLYCGDADIIGAPFIIMERRRGIVVRKSIPEAFTAKAEATRQMSEALVDALAKFHAVDYRAVGLTELGKPAGFIERQIEGWYQRWQGAKTEDLLVMDEVYVWLKENLPVTNSYSLVHNDFKLDNVMFAADDPGQIVAVFDWDMCTLGDPLSDLGALLSYWTEVDDPSHLQSMAMMPTGDLGFLTRSNLVDLYTQKSGRQTNNINFYHTLGLFRLAVIIAQIYIRYTLGQTQDQRFAAFGPLVPLLVRAAAEVAFD
jgi:aminoglycoside phosphotransferase (APT) family kinase protein